MTKEQYLLTVLSEECAEVAKEAAKAIRFGMGNRYHEDDPSNEQKLRNEVNEVIAVAKMLGIFTEDTYKQDLKVAKVEKYYKLSQYLGRVE